MFTLRGEGDFGRGIPYGVAIAIAGVLVVWGALLNLRWPACFEGQTKSIGPPLAPLYLPLGLNRAPPGVETAVFRHLLIWCFEPNRPSPRIHSSSNTEVRASSSVPFAPASIERYRPG
jgi:hypothetical protein